MIQSSNKLTICTIIVQSHSFLGIKALTYFLFGVYKSGIYESFLTNKKDMQIHYPLVGNKICMLWKLETSTHRFKCKLDKTIK